jgi:hypothetical protein
MTRIGRRFGKSPTEPNAVEDSTGLILIGKKASMGGDAYRIVIRTRMLLYLLHRTQLTLMQIHVGNLVQLILPGPIYEVVVKNGTIIVGIIGTCLVFWLIKQTSYTAVLLWA